MTKPLRIVLTGSTCAGKSMTHRAMLERFGKDAMGPPEIATRLLHAGFYRSGKAVGFTPSWLNHFISAIVPTQLNLEDSFVAAALKKKRKVLFFDRGLLDPATFIPGLLPEFKKGWKISRDEAYARYDLVFILQSTAECAPELYGKANNRVRHHDLDQARSLAGKVTAVWGSHPNVVHVPGAGGIESVIDTIERTVRQRIA